LFGTRDALPQLTPSWEKFFLPLDGEKAKFEQQRRVVSAVYLFAPRVAEVDAPRLETISTRQGLLDLVQNTYMNWLLTAISAPRNSTRLLLVTQVPVRRIVPHADPGRTALLCDLILADAKCLSTDCDSTSLISKR
jgi:hypothetical protein